MPTILLSLILCAQIEKNGRWRATDSLPAPCVELTGGQLKVPVGMAGWDKMKTSGESKLTS